MSSTGPGDTEPARDDVAVEWRGVFTDDELDALHAEAFESPLSDHPWNRLVERHSLGRVTARDALGLVGFVDVAWDGRAHAFLLDTAGRRPEGQDRSSASRHSSGTSA